jgi:hypothetical protein
MKPAILVAATLVLGITLGPLAERAYGRALFNYTFERRCDTTFSGEEPFVSHHIPDQVPTITCCP